MDAKGGHILCRVIQFHVLRVLWVPGHRVYLSMLGCTLIVLNIWTDARFLHKVGACCDLSHLSSEVQRTSSVAILHAAHLTRTECRRRCL